MDRPQYSHAPGFELSRQVKRALVGLALVILSGTCGFALIEGWSLAHALYFTLITITTVGYGDEGISDSGRAFATVILIGGIGIAYYSIALVVHATVSSTFAWRRRMQKRIERLDSHVIICGFGRMGRTAARELSLQGVPFVVVEASERAFREASEAGYLTVGGSATDDEVLVDAGIARAAYLLCCVDSDAENILIAISARGLQPDVVLVARAEHEQALRKLRRAGVDHVVSPFQSGALEMARAISDPRTLAWRSRGVGSSTEIELAEVQVEHGARLVGRSLAALGHDVRAVAIERSGEEVSFAFPAHELIRGGDLLVLAGHSQALDRVGALARSSLRQSG